MLLQNKLRGVTPRGKPLPVFSHGESGAVFREMSLLRKNMLISPQNCGVLRHAVD